MPRKAADSASKLYLLGPFRFENASGSRRLSARKEESLVAYLTLHPGEHSREKLSALFWGDSTDELARNSLRTGFKNLRKQLGDDFLHSDRETVQLNPDFPLWVDAREFLQAVEPQAGTTSLHGAVDLYRGDLLTDFYDDWIFPQRERYRTLYLDSLMRLSQERRTQGDWVHAVEYAQTLLVADATNEDAHRQLMFCYSASGNRAAAYKQYEECKRILRTELDSAPSPETTALYHEIKAAAAELVRGPSRLANIPVSLTSFVGRQRELEQIKTSLAQLRLVTLTGAGGSGKTRLAMHVATALLETFPDGVGWVELVGVNDPNLVARAVAQVLSAREAPGQSVAQSIIRHLGSMQLLLVLDNCEHVIDACAQLSQELLQACPGLRILATSREALGIFGESVYRVPTLSLPSTMKQPVHEILEHEATRLFVERALAAKFGFALNDQNALAIEQICRRLDGIPLAIELAAARVKLLSPEEIAARLDDRFEFLTLGSRTALPRHQTLRATIDWSYNLLTEPEKILFRRLAVFAGGFTLNAAMQVCTAALITPSQVLDLVAHLSDKSLIVVASPNEGVEQSHYRLLESIREYARGRLQEAGETAQVEDRHLDYCVGLAEKAESNAFGAESLAYSRHLDQELDNFRAAMEWAIETHQPNTVFRFASALNYFWPYFWAGGLDFTGDNRSSIGGELQDILNKALNLPEGMARTRERARVLNSFGFFFWTGISPFNPRRELEEALSIGRELQDNAIITTSLCNLGRGECVLGNYVAARSLLEQGMELLRELGPAHKTAYLWALILSGDVGALQGDLSRAQQYYGECSDLLRQINDRNLQGYLVRRLGVLAMSRGETDKAVALCKESLTFNLEMGDERGLIACIAGFAGLCLACGRLEPAATLLGAVRYHLDVRSSRLLPTDQLEYNRNVALLHSLSDAVVTANKAPAEHEMTLLDAIAYAQVEANDLISR